ncbi:hypothetical protein WOLCODRAFT_159510 [Wolfiporia cocos MD-104 SS10]|uniref:Uncharacterized protein n=1 Tax=Wolfiporia cocos (strain MD-104) TaxID=742152 RepID=A0A2H3J414_WOLCO|nr:hypothetical protein WOLCODRAFT_159510 [Wolfiporia cocos MD-104 SS10]
MRRSGAADPATSAGGPYNTALPQQPYGAQRGSLCETPKQRQRTLLGNSQTQDPRPGRSKTRRPLQRAKDIRRPTRTPPVPSGSDEGHSGQTDRASSGRPYGKGNRPSRSTPRTTGKALRRQGNPHRAPTSNGSAVCLNNRATSSACRANSGLRSQRRAAAQPPATGSRARPEGTRYPGGVPLTKPPAGTGNRHPLRRHGTVKDRGRHQHQARRQGLDAQVYRHKPPPQANVPRRQGATVAKATRYRHHSPPTPPPAPSIKTR